MEKFIPYEKLSKKEKRKLDNARRQTWGALNPTTRKSDNIKIYNRKKRQDWKKELPDPVAFVLYKFLGSTEIDQYTALLYTIALFLFCCLFFH